MNSVVDLLKTHRSVRKFTSQPITDEQLVLIVEAAQSASTSGFIQAYSIIRITDRELRKQLAYLGGEQPYIEQCAEFLVFCADLYRLKVAGAMHGTEMKGEYMEAFILATVDTALAAQNAMIAAESMGLGGCYIGGIRNRIEEVSDLLELPEKVYPVFGICLGYPDQNTQVKPRLPHSIVLKENRYDTSEDERLLAEYDEMTKKYYAERTNSARIEGWTGQMSVRMSKEARLHMRPYLEKQRFGFK